MMTASFFMVFCSIVCIVLGLWSGVSARQRIHERIYADVAQEQRPTILSRLAHLLEPVNRWLPTGRYTSHIARRLGAAGLQITPMQFVVLQEIGLVTGGFLYVVTMGSGALNVGWLALFLCLGGCVPSLWLGSRIQQRKLSISRDLPEVVDLLSLCIDAGLDFMNSLARIVKEFRPCPTVEELAMVIQEVRVGKRRRDALRSFSMRVQTTEASSFSRTLVQADRMGTGIAEALRILSEDMRIQRFHWAERFAQQAPLKMLIPLLFSLLAALIIVAGPILIQFLRGGFGIQNFGGGGVR